ncbi:EAL domain-containing protein [Desulfuromonas carbonis]|uniref:putative bifunctional diguanylate cyclase/phosphodiesterase n=1 Tax=Desulfuromonas sp. DDH964 TaxID=1823759 RepID=UPI00078C169B|nr:EAL domain-containing protein [Desulfuromonas sp. DDH964]AMV73616.1 response receiver sensor diguanylate cyclase/phosphodiesterase, PAS domain-containing [Desulfuromonas sp. DDH964]
MSETTTPAVKSSPAHPLVLVVAAAGDQRQAIHNALDATGFAVCEAASGEEGVARAAELHPDLVLLAAEFPESDGTDLCRKLREGLTSSQIPILVMTSGADPRAIEGALGAGASDFVTTPLDTALLAPRLRNLLRTSGNLARLRESESQLNHAQRLARLGSWEWSATAEGLELSLEGARLLDLGKQQIPVEALLAQVDPADRPRVEKAFDQARQEGKPFALDYRVQLANGTLRYLHTQGVVGEVGNGGQFALSGTIQDISERRRAEEKIHYLAHYDPLTGLPNRLLFNEQLVYILSYARRKRHQLALLFLDLDRFKTINESLGHRAGDELLRQVAERLKEATRKTDFVARQARDEFPQAIARLGGDEFSIWLPDIHHVQDVMKVLRRVHQVLARPFSLEGQEVFISSSIGIALYPNDGNDVESLLKNADTAMRHAKQEGRDTYRFYSGAMNSAARRLLTMENSLHRALERNELLLYYQPQLDLASGTICGAETLMRWHQQGKDLIMPGEFIPLAEESGLIVQLGEWALHAACNQAQCWQDEGLPQLQIAVNLSSRQFWKEHLATSVARVLAETGLDPRWLHLELTENILMQNRVGTLATLNFLQELGVGIALDDFGTGLFSLSHLKQFPLNDLKIDRSFIRDLHLLKESGLIVKAIINMGHSLGFRVVAEGVEHQEQLAILRQEGCDCAQGFLIGKPMPAEEFARFLRSWRPDALPAPLRPADKAKASTSAS